MLFKANSLNLQASVKIGLAVCSGRQARKKQMPFTHKKATFKIIA